MFRMHYCSYMAHNPDRDIIDRPAGRMDYLFLLLLSPMEFQFADRTETARPGACLLYTPGTPQHYQAVCEFSNSYLHFYCDDPSVLTHYSLPENRLFYPGNTEQINDAIRRLYREYLTQPPYYEESMDLMIHQFFLLIARDRQTAVREEPDSSLYRSFSELRLHMLSSCEQDWTLARLCSEAGFGKSQFCALYKKLFQTTPRSDLIHARIERDRYLLTSQTVQIQQAAAQSGFRNLYHFSRCFKEICGCSPSRYRSEMNPYLTNASDSDINEGEPQVN